MGFSVKMRRENSNLGVSRKHKIGRTKDTGLPDDPVPSISITTKQKEVLQMFNSGLNYTKIHKELKINKSSLDGRILGLIKKKLIYHTFGIYKLTKLGKLAAETVSMGCPVSQTKTSKGQHANEFTVKINNFPRQWNLGGAYFQDYLRFDKKVDLRHFFYNKQANQWFVYYSDCTIRISPGTKEITFFIAEQIGNSVDEIYSKVWDLFVFYFLHLENNGFGLENTVSSKSSEFTNPNGFFAKLASYSNVSGYRIDCYDKNKSFWIDYSPPDYNTPEEETDSIDIARRNEDLARSALNSNSNFEDLDMVVIDLDKLKEIVTGLVKIHVTELQLRTDLLYSKTDSLYYEKSPYYVG